MKTEKFIGFFFINSNLDENVSFLELLLYTVPKYSIYGPFHLKLNSFLCSTDTELMCIRGTMLQMTVNSALQQIIRFSPSQIYYLHSFLSSHPVCLSVFLSVQPLSCLSFFATDIQKREELEEQEVFPYLRRSFFLHCTQLLHAWSDIAIPGQNIFPNYFVGAYPRIFPLWLTVGYRGICFSFLSGLLFYLICFVQNLK